ncbi:hypothetical protein COY32_04965, partial [candidate division WWE3 bacterium CG_4_10_14_0_2_um_filter_41_14]
MVLEGNDTTAYSSTGFIATNYQGIQVLNQSTTDNTVSSLNFTHRNSSAAQSVIASIQTSLNNTELAFLTEGSNSVDERLRITSAGNVGIGTTGPGNKLDVRQTDSVTDGYHAVASFYNNSGNSGILTGWSANGSSNNGGFVRSIGNSPLYLGTSGTLKAVTVLDTGNVGIGTTSPIANLSVVGNEVATGYVSAGTSNTYGALTGKGGTPFTTLPSYGVASVGTIDYAPASGWNGNGFLFTNQTSGSTAFSMAMNQDIAWFGFLGASSLVSLPLEISTTTIGVGVPLIVGNDLSSVAPANQLWVNGSATIGTGYKANTAPTNGLLVQGNVGIGTTGPLSKLDVTSGTAIANADIVGSVGNFEATTPTGQSSTLSLVSNDAVAANIGGVLGFGGNYNGTQYANWASIKGLKADATFGNYGGYMSFFTRLTGAGSVERMRIDTGGNVGIGTTGPHGKFEVFGNPAAGTTVGDFVVDTVTKRVYVGRQSSTGSDGSTFIVRNRVGSENFVVNADSGVSYFNAGNVGIGTTAPNSRLTANTQSPSANAL